jgi:hypothetical protein
MRRRVFPVTLVFEANDKEGEQLPTAREVQEAVDHARDDIAEWCECAVVHADVEECLEEQARQVERETAGIPGEYDGGPHEEMSMAEVAEVVGDPTGERLRQLVEESRRQAAEAWRKGQ